MAIIFLIIDAQNDGFGGLQKGHCIKDSVMKEALNKLSCDLE